MSIRGFMMGAALAATMASAPAFAATEYLVNGGFETGDLTGWTNTGNLGYSGIPSSLSDLALRLRLR